MDVYIANLFAWILSVLFAFVTNKLFVFHSKSMQVSVFLKEMFSFFFFRLLSLGIDMGGMFVCLNFLSMGKMISKVFMNVIVIIANYIFSKLFVFKKSV